MNSKWKSIIVGSLLLLTGMVVGNPAVISVGLQTVVESSAEKAEAVQ